MAQLVAITKHGMVPPNAPDGYVSDMPAFAGKLTDRQIENVLLWIGALGLPRSKHAGRRCCSCTIAATRPALAANNHDRSDSDKSNCYALNLPQGWDKVSPSFRRPIGA